MEKAVEVPKVCKLSKDAPEKFFRVDARRPSPVVLLLARAASVWVEAQVILVPLDLITQHLSVGKANVMTHHICISLSQLKKRCDLIGFSQLSKLCFGIWVIWIGVRVMLFC